MIFVTGDVHDMDMGGPDQACLAKGMTEVDCAVKYARMAAEHGVRVTLFVSGRAARDESGAIAELAENPFVEIGGHTWDCLQPTWKHLLRQRFRGSYYGSRRTQCRDIAATLRELEARTGSWPLSWRTHAYRGDNRTNRILDELGCRVVSDTVGPWHGIEPAGTSLWSLPINTPPDHEYLFHGRFTQSWFARDQLLRQNPWKVMLHPGAAWHWSRASKELGKRVLGLQTPRKPFGEAYLPAREWTAWLREEMRDRLARVGFATLLLHPACMEVLDGMQTLETLFREIGRERTAFASAAGRDKPPRR